MTRPLVISLILIALYLSLFVLPMLASPILGTGLFTITLIIVVLYGETKLALYSALVGGALMDLISPYPYGTMIVSLLAMITIIRWVFRTQLTNRSLITYLSLTALGIAIQHIVAWGYSIVIGTVGGGHALSIPTTMTTLLLGGSDIIRASVLALIVYSAIRLTGRSYATLISQDF